MMHDAMLFQFKLLLLHMDVLDSSIDFLLRLLLCQSCGMPKGKGCFFFVGRGVVLLNLMLIPLKYMCK